MKLSILGAGPLGQALATLAAEAGADPLLGYRPDPVRGLATTTDPEALLGHAELLLLAVPGWELPALLPRLPLGPQHRVVVCGRGPAPDGGFLSELVANRSPALRTAVLGGPLRPDETLRGAAGAVVVASRYSAVVQQVQAALHSRRLRVYTSDDPRGVELAAAFARPIAVAVGAADAMGMGASARGLVVSRGLAEATRLGRAVGAGAEAFHGLAGMGEIIACMSAEGEPAYEAGRALALGQPHAEEEAFRAAEALTAWGAARGVELPVTRAVLDIHQGRVDVATAFQELMGRSARLHGE